MKNNTQKLFCYLEWWGEMHWLFLLPISFICFRRRRTCFFIVTRFWRPFTHSSQWQLKNGQPRRLWPLNFHRTPWLIQSVHVGLHSFLSCVCFFFIEVSLILSRQYFVQKLSTKRVSFFRDDALNASIIAEQIERNVLQGGYEVNDKHMSVKKNSRSWLGKVLLACSWNRQRGIHSPQNKI